MSEAALQGKLGTFRLPDVLNLLCTARKSGTLAVTHADKQSSLFFRDGHLIFANANQEQFRLGNILLRTRRITPAQRDRIDALMTRGGGRFGDRALEEGILTEAQLNDFLKVQVSEIVFDALLWHDGTFAFTEEAILPEHAVTISIDLKNLMMEGARRIEEWEQCARLLPDPRMIFRVVVAPRDEKITLTADEWKILFLINGQRTIEDLVRESDEDPLHVYRVLYGLYANKLIELATPRPADLGTETMKQTSPRFGAESTVRDAEPADDTHLLLSSDTRLSYAEIVRPTIGRLIVERDGTVFPLTEPEYLIGRHRENTIQLGDLGISGFHARLYRGPEGYVLEDLKSRNGTWINGERILQQTLTSGDRVHLGQLDLLYEVLFSS
jgi:hypothetical protein